MRSERDKGNLEFGQVSNSSALSGEGPEAKIRLKEISPEIPAEIEKCDENLMEPGAGEGQKLDFY
jgi:hypothetical protein